MLKYDIELNRAKRNLIKRTDDITSSYKRKFEALIKERDAALDIVNRDYQSVVDKVALQKRTDASNKHDVLERERLRQEKERLRLERAEAQRQVLELKLKEQHENKISKNGVHKFNDYRDIQK